VVPCTDPFAMLGSEHTAVESVLALLDVLVNRSQRGLQVQRPELAAIMDYFNDFGVLGHHEKEETILLPALLDAGFDWQDGPLSAMRRDHRQEHYFLRVLTQLSRLHDWSAEDGRQFSSVASEFTQFLRNHMHFENHHVFAPARERLSATALASLAAELSRFNTDNGSSPEAARERLQEIFSRYEADVSASA
jgi:hemerythrin-like domain-containing protein